MSLKDEFRDKEYRQAYAESFANTLIATQIRLLRGAMTQAEFADLVGIKQSRVSVMEDENYGNWSTKTLKTLAAKKDVVFLGRFVSFGQLLDAARRMSENDLRVRPFAEDPVFADTRIPIHAIGEASTTGHGLIFDQLGIGAFPLAEHVAAEPPKIDTVNVGLDAADTKLVQAA